MLWHLPPPHLVWEDYCILVPASVYRSKVPRLMGFHQQLLGRGSSRVRPCVWTWSPLWENESHIWGNFEHMTLAEEVNLSSTSRSKVFLSPMAHCCQVKACHSPAVRLVPVQQHVWLLQSGLKACAGTLPAEALYWGLRTVHWPCSCLLCLSHQWDPSPLRILSNSFLFYTHIPSCLLIARWLISTAASAN